MMKTLHGGWKGYDALQRLVSGGTVALPESYTYDAEGNRLVSHLSTAHLTDDGNRLVQDDQFDYTYDDNGNLATKTDRVTLAMTSYSYDAQDELIRIDFPDATFATYAYDALGRRIAKDVDDGAGGREVTAYVYDGPDILMEFDGIGGFLARYAHGDRVDQPLAMTRGGQDYYIQADHQGSVIRVTDSAGAVVNAYEYDAYGQRLAATEGVEIAYGYTGREYDAESGLMFYRARVYDPTMGRFLQTDPIRFAAGDLNLYRYVGNNPVNAIDPTGLTILPFPETPTPLDRLSDFAEGLYSYPRGIGRAARFGARYAGILGRCEADRAGREVDLLVDIGTLLYENEALRDVAGDLLLRRANRKSDVIEGRATAMGLVLIGSTRIPDRRIRVAIGAIGLSALPGDIMYAMEKGARTVEDLIPAVLEGALPENLQPSKSCDCPNGG